ncbi:lactonase family protein [Xylocopilactobacillus apicola]|uniref:6-phosphogluconolactonase n=1 Tax=Xylocopilactobacillus apicola TaxID=2932184 RepID=A0AAU9CX66_9LACO|nr:lactonase family protein [Xylocopilactobacillus apicola]BDR58582.1 6-phosphogluconolactonase [Xylocopilactobacillus apicola]
MKIISGGYTKKTSKGIYISNYDTEAQVVSKPELLIEVDNPTYLATYQDTVVSVVKEGSKAGIACYKKQDDQYKQVSSFLKDQTPPAYVAVNPEHNLIFDANYHMGTINLYSLSKEGHIDLLDTYTNHGKGVKEEQDSSHFHYVNLTPDGKLITCDLGTDEIIFFDITDNKLTPTEKIKVNPGFGPRHVIFNPNGKYFYCVGELGSAVKVFTYGESITELHEYPTIPASYQEHNGASAIKITKDGKYLYLANRGFNSIIAFSVLDGGSKLEEIQNISTEGDFPRDFALDDKDQLLFASNQNSDNGTMYQVKEDGTLKVIQANVQLFEPTFVEFV